MNLLKLQNGSDIRGVAMEGIKGEDVNLTPEIAGRITLSFVSWLSEKTGKPAQELRVSVGRDPRLSGPVLTKAIIEQLIRTGCKVWDYGLASTPAMFMSTIMEEMNGAIMITASHLPFNRNGMKFFHRGGGLEKSDITDILKRAEIVTATRANIQGSYYQKDFLADYAAYLCEYIRREAADPEHPQQPLKGTSILVDAGNGSGGFFAGQVLRPLGADVSGSLFLEPDGRFPNHPPNPESREALKALSAAVKDSHADLGIIFDTDVDRAAIIGHNGEPINRNALIALASAIVLEKYPDTWIVTDSITSNGLTEFIEKHLGGHHHRFKRGYRNVINEAIRLNEEGKETHFAIETSGHAALKENYFLDDGAYLVAFILVRMARLRQQGKRLEDMIESLRYPAEEKEFRMRINTEDVAAYGQQVLEALEDFVHREVGWQKVMPNYEGIRVVCDKDHGDGWFLLRLSLHDPVLPLNAESDAAGGIRYIVSRLKEFLLPFERLTTDQIDTYLSK